MANSYTIPVIRVKTNISKVSSELVGKLKQLQERDQLLRAVATNVLMTMKERIHKDGVAADGSQIGTYSDGYMKVRTGNFKNADRYTRGKKAGKTKNSGVFTEAVIRLNKETGVFTGEEKVGKARPRYNRTGDTKVICSLTRNMENDIKVLPTKDGYGIGYSNDVNGEKVGWLEETYQKPIFTIGDLERTVITETIQTYLNETLQ